MDAFQWDDLKLVHALVEHRSLNRAAKATGLQQSTLSRRLDRLESALGEILFLRNSEGLRPTTVCEQLLPELDVMHIQAKRVSSLIGQRRDELAGNVRVALPNSFAEYLLIPALEAFRDEYPSITLEFLISRDLVDMTRSEADVALRFVRLTSGDLIVKRLGTMRMSVHGVERELARKKNEMRWVTWPRAEAWVKNAFDDPIIALRTGNNLALLAALKHGIGVSIVADTLARQIDLPRSRKKFPPLPEHEVFMVSHEADRHNRRVQVVREFLAESCKPGFSV